MRYEHEYRKIIRKISTKSFCANLSLSDTKDEEISELEF